MTWLLPGCDKQQMKSAVGVGFSMRRAFRMAMGYHKENGYLVIKWQQLFYPSLKHRAYQSVLVYFDTDGSLHIQTPD